MAGKGRRRRKVGVCVECRQQKLKCNTEDTFPDPCARCVAKGVPCTIDPSFKREAAREKTKEMAAELMRFRQQRATSPMSLDDQSTATGAWTDQGEGRATTATLELRSAILGSATLDEDEINERFWIYRTHFHPFLPVISLEIPTAALQQCSPFLFWTIIIISCRYRALSDQDMVGFEDHYTALAQKTSMTSPITLHTIQALTLICTWPLMPRQRVHDPGYLYCSAALGGASFLNLDRSLDRYVYHNSQISELDLQNMSRTWIALFCVSSVLELWYGTPRYFDHPLGLASIESHIQQSNLPHELAAEAAMMAVVAKFRANLTPDTNMAGLDTLTQASCSEINVLSQRYTMIGSDQLQFTALVMKMRILNASITSWNTHLAGSDESCMAGQILTAIPIARGIIDTYGSLLKGRGEVPPQTQFLILPKSCFRAFLVTTFFLVRFCCSNETCGPVTRNESRRAVEDARQILLQCSQSPGRPSIDDIPGQGAEVLRILLAHMDEPGAAEQLHIDDGRENSIVRGSLRRVYQLCNQASSRTDLLRYIDPINPSEISEGAGGTFDEHTSFDEQTFVSALQDFSDFEKI